MIGLLLTLAAGLLPPAPAPAAEPAVPEGAWAGGFWIGDRCIPYILRVHARTGAPSGDATLDRLDRIQSREPVTSLHMAGDSLRIAFAQAGGEPWTFVLEPGPAALNGYLVSRTRSGEHRFPASFVPMQDPGPDALARHAGLYESTSGERVRISADEDGTLLAHFQRDDRFQMLFPSGPERFFAGDGPTRAAPAIVAVRIANGTMEWSRADTARVFVRTRESRPPLKFTRRSVVRGALALPLARIPAGRFSMGQHQSNAETVARLGLNLPEDTKLPIPEPLRPTTLTRPFLMSRHEVTNAWFAAFVEETGYMTDAERAGYGLVWNGKGFDRTPGISWRHPGVEAPPDAPVVFVSWNDATAFTRWLAGRLGREVRLPTEAEWEYACAAGTVTMFSCGDDTLELDRHAWSNRNATAARPVGTKLANPWGLHDMHGNVWEWCADGHGEIIATPATDPTGAPGSRTKVLRGASWINGPWSLRTALRAHESPTLAEPHIGFRCVVETGR